MNSLDLHLEEEMFFSYKPYPGKIMETLSKLLSEGRSPFLVSGVMRRFSEIQKHSASVQKEWADLCPVTADLIARHPYGSARFVRGTPKVWKFILAQPIRDGVVELKGTTYDRLGGLHLAGIAVRKYIGRGLPREEALEDGFLLHAAQGRETLERFLDYRGEQEKNDKNLVLVTFPRPREYPFLQFLGFSNSGRYLGCPRFDDPDACLVGFREKDQHYDFASVWLESMEEMNQ